MSSTPTLAPPALHPMGRLYLPVPETMTTASGATVTWLDQGDMEVNRLTVVTDGGIMHSGAVPGLAATAGELACSGTASRTDQQIANLLEDQGAWISASTSYNHRALTVHSLNSTMDAVLPVVRDIVAEPSFDPSVVGVLLENNARRLERELEKVDVMASRAIKPMLYGAGSPLAVLSTPENLRALDPAALGDFHRRGMNPAHVHIYLAGQISDRLLRQVCDMADTLPSLGSGWSPAEVTRGQTPGDCDVFLSKPGALQSALRLAIPSIGRRHPDYVALHIAVRALGGYFGSRLMASVRERMGMTYGVSASLMGYPAMSFITVATQTANAHRQAVTREVLRQMEQMKDPCTYTAVELDRLRGHVLTSLAQALDTPFTVMDQYLNRQLVGTPAGYYGQMEAAARTLTAETLASVASKYFDTTGARMVWAGGE